MSNKHKTAIFHSYVKIPEGTRTLLHGWLIFFWVVDLPWKVQFDSVDNIVHTFSPSPMFIGEDQFVARRYRCRV